MKLKIELDTEKANVISSMDYDGKGFLVEAKAPLSKVNFEVAKHLKLTPAVTMPPAIRYLSPTHDTVLWERPPGYVTFQWTGSKQEHLKTDAPSQNTVRLPLPWQRYIMLLAKDNHIANLLMFFASHPIKSLDNDPMGVPPILNFYKKGRLCPAVYAKAPEYDFSISGAIDAAYDLVWNSGFNFDTTHALATLDTVANFNPLHMQLQRSVDQMYRFWAGQTIETVLKWKWFNAYESFLSVIRSSDFRHDYICLADDVAINLAMSIQDAAR